MQVSISILVRDLLWNGFDEAHLATDDAKTSCRGVTRYAKTGFGGHKGEGIVLVQKPARMFKRRVYRELER